MIPLKFFVFQLDKIKNMISVWQQWNVCYQVFLLYFLLCIAFSYRSSFEGMYHDSIGVLGECSSAKRSKTSDFEEATTVNWTHLPDVVISEIFDNLNPTDRLNASSLCKHWRKNLYNKRWVKLSILFMTFNFLWNCHFYFMTFYW